jgi:hypothetical protein
MSLEEQYLTYVDVIYPVDFSRIRMSLESIEPREDADDDDRQNEVLHCGNDREVPYVENHL